MRSRILLSSVILLIITASFGSLAYPSINVQSYSTETVMSSTMNRYPYTIYSTTSYYSTFPQLASILNTDCELISGGFAYPPCIPPYRTVTVYATNTTLSVLATTSTSTMQLAFTNILTHSSSQNVPPYSYLGLSDSQFLTLALFVLVMAGLAMGYSHQVERTKQTKLSQITQTKSSCVKCGIELPPASVYCNKCGTKQP